MKTLPLSFRTRPALDSRQDAAAFLVAVVLFVRLAGCRDGAPIVSSADEFGFSSDFIAFHGGGSSSSAMLA